MKRPGQTLCHFPALLLVVGMCYVSFAVEEGTVECNMNEQVFGGTIVHAQATSRSNIMVVEPPKKPINISCVTNATHFFKQYTICYWDEAGNSHNTTYRVTMEQNDYSGHCTSQLGQKYCQLSKPATTLKDNMIVTVTAQNSVANVSATVYFHPWEIQKFDPPKDIRVKPLPTGLRVEWDKNNYHYHEEMEKCEVQCVEGTNVKIVSHKITPSERAIFVGDVKPCTRYAVVVRCAYVAGNESSLWSDWSIETTVISTLNVSTVPFDLWGKVLEPYTNGTRHVQLMWKGPSPFCKAIDEYRLSVDSGSFRHLNSTQHHATVLLTTAHHEITIAIYKNSTMLRHSSLKIPFAEKEMPPVQKPIANALGGLILVSWDAPSTPVKYYVIEWFTDPTEADRPSWSRTQDTNISLPGDLPYKLYTVTITPLYDDGPGQRSTIYAYAKQGAPAKVEQVKKIEADATWLTVEWKAVRPDQCCGFVVNYTVFYRVSKESKEKQLNVTVNHTNQSWEQVTLRNLHPSTMYHVHVRANSIDNSSDSEPHTLKTEAYGKAFINMLVYGLVGLILLLVIPLCIFMVRRKVVNLMVPNPQFSTMAVWVPEKSLKPSFSDNLGLGNSHKEKILLCQADTEMDTKMAFAADTDSTLSHPMENRTDGASVALDTSASSGQAESSGGIILYSIWECQTKSPAEAVEPNHQQPDQASPSPRNPYLNQMPVCGSRGLLTSQSLGPNMQDEGKTVMESSEQEPLNPAPSATIYVTEDMLRTHCIKRKMVLNTREFENGP